MTDSERMMRIRTNAAEWWSLIATASLDANERSSFERWYEAAEENRSALSEQAAVWEALGDVAVKIRADAKLAPPHTEYKTFIARRTVLAGSFAASAAAALSYRPPFGLWPSLPELRANYRTATGERKTISPVPHVSIVMNTATSLDVVTQASGVPEIHLVAGEVAVVTAAVLPAPMRIGFRGGSVSVAEADVNILCADAAVEVTCLRGRADFLYKGASVEVEAGQQVRRGKKDESSVSAKPVRDVTGWREGRLIFKRVSLAAVIAEVNRYRRGRIVLLNDALGQRLVDVVLPQSHIDDIIVIVRETFKAKVTEFPAGFVLIS